MTAQKTALLPILAVVMGLVLLSSPAHAWWCKGHMAVAEIARRHLEPNVAALVEAAASDLSKSGPFPKSPDFVQLSCWADDVKSLGLGVMGEWHYIDTPYNPQNVPIKKWPVSPENVLTVIKGLVKTLENPKKLVLPQYVISFAIANLVHFYGDIHQPLHATELHSPAYPNGDGGGNTETVYVNGSKMKLHALWDSICEGPQVDPPRPLKSSDYADIKKFADYLEDTYKFTAKQKAETNASVMADESYTAAVEAVYPGISNGVTVNETYLAQCKATAEPRVALAGYRLATQLNALFANNSVVKGKYHFLVAYVKKSLVTSYTWLTGNEEGY
ncbi:class I nuclease-like protein [Trypanosoma theileri]|uniref:Class I nuclease-like protein n=1 Tax=Trypanosoma theileri TaxID=67003 RepID=A0A1X0P2K7_9TRYP|nr:class I nuclease-like protein [Trypanosoma theileri]ORC90923.1 class I nuclease-like protein [Trypanosoma theileri]